LVLRRPFVSSANFCDPERRKIGPVEDISWRRIERRGSDILTLHFELLTSSREFDHQLGMILHEFSCKFFVRADSLGLSKRDTGMSRQTYMGLKII
jgi:hypothetical protein